jgi:molybdopterin/thiamine biosynthesis adenylyltransferase
MKIVRIKPHVLILLYNEDLLFKTDLYSCATFGSKDLIHQLLPYLQSNYTLSQILDLAKRERGIPQKKIKSKLDELFRLNILEFFSKQEEESACMERYKRQLSYFDLFEKVSDRKKIYSIQNKLKNAHVLILGVGGIGSYAGFALAGAGVGEISLMDGDTIEKSNLNRQILYDEHSLGKRKVDVAKARLLAFNSEIKYNTLFNDLKNPRDLEQILKGNELKKIDLIILSADQPFSIRSWVDQYSRSAEVPYVACGYCGSVGIIGPFVVPAKRSKKNEPKPDIKMKKLYQGAPPSMACTNGILANIVSLEAIKYLTGISEPLTKNKILFLNLEDLSQTAVPYT